MHNSPLRGPTLDHVWITAAGVLILLGPLVAPVPPNDLWFHVASGRQMLASGVIPQADSFSYTRYGAPLFDQAWLAQIALFAMDQAGGVPLLLLVHAATLLLAYGLLLRLCVRRSGQLRLSIALFIVTLPVAFPDWNIRPQTFAFPLFVGFLYLLTAYGHAHAERRADWRARSGDHRMPAVGQAAVVRWAAGRAAEEHAGGRSRLARTAATASAPVP